MQRRTYAIGFLVLVLLVGVGWWTGDEGVVSKPLTTTPDVGPFRVEVTTTGELQAKNSVQIKGPSGASRVRIFEMEIAKLVDEGTEVDSGDFVAELDRSPLQEKTEEARLSLQKSSSKFEQAQLDTTLTLSEARDAIVDLRFVMEEAKLNKEQSQYEAPSVQRRAEIEYERAQRDYEKAQVNYKTKVRRAEATMREVEAELLEDRRQMEQLNELSNKFTIRAPTSGMVVYHRDWKGDKVTEGSSTRYGDPVVATLPDLSVMESVTFVNEVDVQKLQPGQQVTIGLDADPDKKLSGRVSKVANIGQQRPNSDAKVFEVIVEIAGSDSTLRPAMTTSNTILVAQRERALHVPIETLHSEGDSLTYVFLREGSGVVRQEVNVGLINDNSAIVEQGVQPKDRIFLSIPRDTSDLPLHRLKAAQPRSEDARSASADGSGSGGTGALFVNSPLPPPGGSR
ncbi:RND transporter [Longibacter salinarum]|uniref:RND transporter n=1 Tax=Longibacter salinarum TaxID=1850348 RepID=A0A2A8CWV1_9BACT|nr:HlyD family efflux transporter periplasmic adaptor subunit [Longibacter salinarum]PEN13172.1 RND transporter [Longibacter salinarum]